jgi:hypothetical protein
MPTKGFFTHERPTSTTENDPEAVIGLAISPFDEDLSFLQGMFQDAGWKLLTAYTLGDHPKPAIHNRLKTGQR